MEPYRVIIAGSRSFSDYEHLKKTCDEVLHEIEFVEIISGNAKGADKLGEKYAKERKLGLNIYPANWDKHGKSAGYKRNLLMAEHANALIAFWDGTSKGTKHMIDVATEKGLKVFVVNI